MEAIIDGDPTGWMLNVNLSNHLLRELEEYYEANYCQIAKHAWLTGGKPSKKNKCLMCEQEILRELKKIVEAPRNGYLALVRKAEAQKEKADAQRRRPWR